MYKHCKTEQSAARQRELEQFLLREMRTSHFEDISISDLCSAMGIPRKAFYRYFSGKQGAFCALIDHTVADMDAYALSVCQRMNGELSKKQRVEILFAFWKGQKPLLDAVENCAMWEQMMDRAVEYIHQRNCKQGQSQSAMEEQDYLIRASIYGVFAILQLWYRRGFPISPADAAATCLFTFTELWTDGSGEIANVNLPKTEGWNG